MDTQPDTILSEIYEIELRCWRISINRPLCPHSCHLVNFGGMQTLVILPNDRLEPNVFNAALQSFWRHSPKPGIGNRKETRKVKVGGPSHLLQ